MDEIIIHDCPICGKSARAIDSRQEAEAKDIVKCDGNEYYTCYRSKENAEWRYIARRSKVIQTSFPIEKPGLDLGYHKDALKL